MAKNKQSIATKTPDDEILVVEIPNTRIKFIEYRNAFNKRRRSSAVGLVVFGIVCLLVTISLWNGKNADSIQSHAIAVSLGVLSAIIGVRYLQVNSLNPKGSLLTNNFTDEELALYVRKFRRTWLKGVPNINFFIPIFIVISIMAKMESTRDFTLLLLSSGLGVFMLGTACIGLYEMSKSE